MKTGKITIIFFMLSYFSTQSINAFDLIEVIKTGCHCVKKGKDYIVKHDMGEQTLTLLETAQEQSKVTAELVNTVSKIANASPPAMPPIQQETVVILDSLKHTNDSLQKTTEILQQSNTTAQTLNTINQTTSQIQQQVNNGAQKLSHIEKVAKIATPIAVVASSLIIVEKLYHFKNFIMSKISPSEEELLKTLETKKRLKYLTAKEKLYDSLVKHVREPRDETGLPYSCREASEEFLRSASITELKNIIKEYNEVFTKAPAC